MTKNGVGSLISKTFVPYQMPGVSSCDMGNPHC